MVTVHLTEAAREDLRDLDRSQQKLVLRALKKLETEPALRGQPLGSRSGSNLTGFRKLVVGNRDLRVVYNVEGDVVVVVWVVGKRADEECYQLARARVELHLKKGDAVAVQRLLDLAFNDVRE